MYDSCEFFLEQVVLFFYRVFLLVPSYAKVLFPSFDTLIQIGIRPK